MDNFEFSTEQNQTIERLSLRMRGVGLMFEILGITKIFAASTALFLRTRLTDLPVDRSALFTGLFLGVFFLFLGHWTRRAGGSFKVIVKSKGDDIRHLMDALGD